MKKFGRISQLFHWLIAAVLLGQIPLAWYMINLPLSPDKLGTYAIHKSIGMVLFSLAVARLVWALLAKRPTLPDSMPRWQVIASKAVEGLLYLLVIVMPITGWLMSSAANFPVSVFGMLTLPDLVAPDEGLMETLKRAHMMQSRALILLAGIHILAALKHHYIDKDHVLMTMLPWSSDRNSG
jgi:cytochrome b561